MANDPLVILVVDHDVLPRNLLATVLQQQGYTVLAAAHGREAAALSQTYTGRIDLLIADVHLPHLRLLLHRQRSGDERPNRGGLQEERLRWRWGDHLRQRR